MNERQRDLFLYLWSRRRAPGATAVALRGAGIGALGGIVFGLLLSPGAPPGVAAYDILGQAMAGLRIYALAVPAFALLGFLGARRVYASQEAMYEAMLASGARVPEAKPAMQAGDRGPAIAVGIAVAVIAGFIAVVYAMYG